MVLQQLQGGLTLRPPPQTPQDGEVARCSGICTAHRELSAQHAFSLFDTRSSSSFSLIVSRRLRHSNSVMISRVFTFHRSWNSSVVRKSFSIACGLCRIEACQLEERDAAVFCVEGTETNRSAGERAREGQMRKRASLSPPWRSLSTTSSFACFFQSRITSSVRHTMVGWAEHVPSSGLRCESAHNAGTTWYKHIEAHQHWRHTFRAPQMRCYVVHELLI